MQIYSTFYSYKKEISYLNRENSPIYQRFTLQIYIKIKYYERKLNKNFRICNNIYIFAPR